MTFYERTLMIADKEFQIAMNEIAHAEAIIESKLELNMQRAELKVLQESGSELDLIYLYEAAGNEADSQKQGQGFIQRMVTAFMNFCTKAWNAIQKIFTGKDSEAYQKLMANSGKFKINIPDPTQVLEQVENAVNKVNAKTVGIGAAIASILAVVGVSIKKITSQKGKVETEMTAEKGKGILGIIDRIKSGLQSIGDKGNDTSTDQISGKDENGSETSTDEKGWISKLIKTIQSFFAPVSGAIAAGLAKIGIPIGGKKDKTGEGTQTPADNSGTATEQTPRKANQPATPTRQTNKNTTGNTSAVSGDEHGAFDPNEYQIASTQMKLDGLSAMLERMGV